MLLGCSSASSVDVAAESDESVASRSFNSTSTATTLIEVSSVSAVDHVPAIDFDSCSQMLTLSATRLGGLGTGRNVDGHTKSIVLNYTTGHPETFAGSWTDRDFGTFVAAFTDEIDVHQAELDRLLGDDRRSIVEVVKADYPLTMLKNTVTELRAIASTAGGSLIPALDVRKNRVTAFVPRLDDEEGPEALADLPAWVCHVVADSPPDVAKTDGLELRDVDVALDPDNLPGRESTELHLILTEHDCAGGLPMGDRLHGSFVRESSDVIAISYWVEGQPAHLCRERHETTAVIELSLPVGERLVLDGLNRLSGSPSLRTDSTYLNNMVALTEQIWTLEFEDYPVTDFTATSETFTIGHGGIVEFEISTAAPREEPIGDWAVPSANSPQFNSIERLHGIGVWASCGEFYLEVLSVDGDLAAAELLFRALSRTLESCS
ncbi:MAG: hypothetical protein ACI81L_000630 [Verrucomicrobiales bacterium]